MPLDAELVARWVSDPSLTPDALRLLIYVASLGEGEHEIANDTLCMLLRCRDERPVYRAREAAETFGLGWKKGGKGHSNRYFWLRIGADPKDSSALVRTIPEDRSAPERSQNGIGPHHSAPIQIGPHQSGAIEAPRGEEGGVGGDGEVPVVSVSSVHTQQLAAARARDPGFPLSEQAVAAIGEQDDRLRGFRGALRDYLQARVPSDRQLWYIRTLTAWLNGTDASVFRLENGNRVPDEEIPGLIATGLNELLTSGERETAIDREHRMKYGDGDIRNLKTKLGILCRQRGDYARRPRVESHQNGNGDTPPLSAKQHETWMRLREEAERRGVDPETAARETYDEARRAS